MTLATQVSSLATAIATDVKVLYSRVGTLTNLATTAKGDLVVAINEVKSIADAAAQSGGAKQLNELTDVTITTPALGNVLRRDATNKFVNVDGLAFFEAAGAASAAQTAAINASQPRDSDLTAIAALTTTAYGRAFLALADQAALAALIPAASTTVSGISPIATQTEVNTGTDTTKSVTSITLATRLAAFAQPLDTDLTAIAALATTSFGRNLLTIADSVALTAQVQAGTVSVQGKLQLATNVETTTGTDTAKATTAAGVAAAIQATLDNNSALGSSTTKAPTQAAVKSYTDALLDATNAMQFKGGIDASANPNYPAANAGWTYKITVAGRIGGGTGPTVEIGDTLYCTTDGSAAGTHATVGANWVITQNNIEGAVTGPAGSINGNIAMFSGTGGKLIADSGYSFDNDGTLSGNSAFALPTEQAVRTYAQPKAANLTSLAGLTLAADKVPYATGAGAWALMDFSSFSRTVMAATTAALFRTAIGAQDAASIGDPNTDFVAVYTAAKA